MPLYILPPTKYLALLLFVIMPAAFSSCANNAAQEEETKTENTQKNVVITEDQVSYFSDLLTSKTKTAIADYATQGLAGGVDGFNLRKVFPKLEPRDFTGVRGLQGDYSVREGELNFTGNAASTSAVLTNEGFKKLLENCAKRLTITVRDKRDIDNIIHQLSGSNPTTVSAKDTNHSSLDGIYKKYIPIALENYMRENHPQWSIPERHRWHPNLFDKYRTNTSAAPIISGDFDCNGQKDYAILMDKQKKGLALMLFLAKGQSFSSQILTENLVHEVPKIEYVLSVVRPGAFKTIDPDNITESSPVRLTCPSIAIALFKELYDGGKDVFYFSNGQLKSCLLEN